MTLMTAITKITKADIPQIISIHKDCICKTNSMLYPAETIEEWLKQITPENIETQLATSIWEKLEVNGGIIGFCQYDLKDKELYQIQISPEFQGKGYGKFLYLHVEKAFIQSKADIISLNSTYNAKGFYENLGFKIIKEVQFPLGDFKLGMFEMKKTLI